MKKTIVLKNVTYFYPSSNTPALENISLEVNRGEFLVIAGPSGGGKSTLVRIILGLIPHIYGGVLHGEVLVNGVNVVEKGFRAIVNNVGVVIQNPENQVVNIVVEEEIAFTLENLLYSPEDIRGRVNEAIKALGIEHLRRRLTHTLSSGEIQKVVIASALALNSKILILDEPLAHLDPQGARELVSTLYKLCKDRGITVIIVEHRLSELAKYADRIVVLNKRILFDGKPTLAINKLLEIGVEVPPISRLFKELNKSPIPLHVDSSVIEILTRDIVNSDGICTSNSLSSSYDDYTAHKSDRAIFIEDLWYKYPDGRIALRGVNLEIFRGEFIAIIGANGAGKTTLIKHFNGLLKPWRGRVLVFGKDTKFSTVAELARNVGIVFQNPLHQFFEKTVLREVLFTLNNFGYKNCIDRALEVLKIFGLEDYAERSPYELSIGEQRRLAIASIVAYEPPIIVLDEPTAGIDYSLKLELLKILTKIIEKKKTVIIVSHDVEFLALAPLTRIVVMANGEVIASGSPREVFYNVDILKDSHIIPPQIVELVKLLGLERSIRSLNSYEFAEYLKRCYNVS
ncbi:MAG: energy-coupling factor ABC transporter ATP-binding protein [Desulfurococcaceae archaeon]|nr:energy-coupling factor ABC transporter ATP-binding protein [Desulfurococcaceae archaeon]